MHLRAIFLGPPGAGKGTLTSRLCKAFPSITSISTGDVLRQQIRDQTAIGREAESSMRKGGLVADNVMISLVTDELRHRDLLNSNASWILDGFPRTRPQAPALDKALSPSHADLNLVVRLLVPDSVILDRIKNRWIHPASGRVYNLTFNPPKVAGKDDVTGEPLVKRPDDNVEVFAKRLESYRKSTLPLLDYYGDKGIVRTFEGDSSDVIFPQLLNYVQTTFVNASATISPPH